MVGDNKGLIPFSEDEEEDDDIDRLREKIALRREKAALWDGRSVSYLSSIEEKMELLEAVVHSPALIESNIQVELLFDLADGSEEERLYGLLRGLVKGTIFLVNSGSSIYIRLENGEEKTIQLDDLIRGLTPKLV